MVRIHIKKAHRVDLSIVREEVQNLAEKLSEELSTEYSWEDGRLVFKRSGASGCIEICDGEVDVDIKLGLALTAPTRGTICTAARCETAMPKRPATALMTFIIKCPESVVMPWCATWAKAAVI